MYMYHIHVHTHLYLKIFTGTLICDLSLERILHALDFAICKQINVVQGRQLLMFSSIHN